MLLFAISQSLIWLQTNGQFIWPWWKRNTVLVAAVLGTIVSFFAIYGTKYVVEHFDGLLWPGRFIAFATGIVVFGLMTWFITGEGISVKTALSFGLAIVLIGIQLFVKWQTWFLQVLWQPWVDGFDFEINASIQNANILKSICLKSLSMA